MDVSESHLILPEEFRPENAYNEWLGFSSLMTQETEMMARTSAWDEFDYKATLRVLRAIVRHQAEVQIFLWQYDVWDTATRGTLEAFAGVPVIADDVPERIQYWSFNRDIGLNDQGRTNLDLPPGFVIAGLCLVPDIYISETRTATPTSFSAGIVFHGGPELSQRHQSEAAAGRELPREDCISRVRFGPALAAGRPVPQREGDTLAALRFLREKFVDARPSFLPRPVRRREEKEGRTIPELRTVLLRARAEDDLSKMTEEQRREYACHFMVTSHWRKPNSRMKEQRPVFVSSYVKGDTSKPFRPPRDTIYSVVR